VGQAAGVPARGFGTQLYTSGQTFFTLGYGDFTPTTLLGRVLAVVEAGLGFGFLGTVVGYLPTMYGSFSQREIEISLMDARAGSPPTAAEFLQRTALELGDGGVDDILRDWDRWAAQLLETHISYPQLAYYRSQHINQSWLATLVVILDSSAVLLARGAPVLRRRGARSPWRGTRSWTSPRSSSTSTRRSRASGSRRSASACSKRGSAHPPPRRRPASSSTGSPSCGSSTSPTRERSARSCFSSCRRGSTRGPAQDNWRRAPWDKLLAERAGMEPDEHF
jgi:hypothetical protein